MQLPDPSLQDDYCQTFQAQVNIVIENQQIKIHDQIMIRLFKKNSQEAYKIQLTSETNVSFFYKCIITKNHFEEYLKKQSISRMKNFTEWFKGFFYKKPFQYSFQLINPNQAQLIVYQQQKYKSYEVIRFTFLIVEHKQLKLNIMYRYQLMKMRKNYLDWYWKQMSQIVKTKNPSLLLQLESKTKKTVFK